MALKPSPGWAVVKRVEAESATKSGIVIASLQANDPSRGQIVDINYVQEGYGEEIYGSFTSGDQVIVRVGTGQPVKIDGVEYALVEIQNIIAKVE
ncbi:MAG TPA: hypothetical protein VIR31_02555 [Nitrososphaeraceae archaeon]